MRLYSSKIVMLSVALAVLSGCDNKEGDATSTARKDGEASLNLWDSEGFAAAGAIYRRSCASCHDPGAGDAPSIGEQEEWDGRSRLWTAVLAEHAKKGYLAMPAKGGDDALTDQQVGAAAEYILAVTYPDLPLD